MKAKFKGEKTEDGPPLTFGKMYDVLGAKAEQQAYQLLYQTLKEIKVKNDLGQEQWYSVNKFKLYAEASAFLKEKAVAGTGQDAAQKGAKMTKNNVRKSKTL